MGALAKVLFDVFGRKLGSNAVTVVFSARLDEAGTDGRSPYTTVAGAVASIKQWQAAEAAWEVLLRKNDVSAFHYQEFEARDGEYAGWSVLKRNRFRGAIDKIIKKNTMFRVAVGIEHAVHRDIKKRMKGISGFHPDSDYSLCFRYLMFLACKTISENFTQDAKLTLLLEGGPWAKGAVEVFTRVQGMTGKRKPAKFAHMLGGIAVEPKGVTRTLEIADYLVGVAHKRMLDGKFIREHNPQVAILLNRVFLEKWYAGMIAEKDARRAYVVGRTHGAG